jgi:aspartate racemase
MAEWARSPKVIGLLGGMSWPSTITYYRELNLLVHNRLGAPHSARILIWSDDYEIVERMQLSGRWDDAGDLLASGAKRLQAGGADLLGIACNTMHKVAPAVRESVSIPLIDLIEAAATAAQEQRCFKTAILGTRFTVSMGRYQDELARRGIQTTAPSPSDQTIVDEIIYNELCRGSVTDESRKKLQSVVSRLVDAGADSIMLACTELNLLVDGNTDRDGPRVIDSTTAHIQCLVEAAINSGGPS